ncbi:MAG: hypothetical protein ABJQ29_08375 [Luteolibacter sp.]
MHWTEPASADDSHAELEKKLWDREHALGRGGFETFGILADRARADLPALCG